MTMDYGDGQDGPAPDILYVRSISGIWFFAPSRLYALPILDTLQKMTNSLLVNVDIPINTKRLKD
jgi:hypothetical protein